jgi:predicted secreted protein
MARRRQLQLGASQDRSAAALKQLIAATSQTARNRSPLFTESTISMAAELPSLRTVGLRQVSEGKSQPFWRRTPKRTINSKVRIPPLKET